MDKTCMSYWLPKLEAAGLPTPRSKMLPMSSEAHRDIFRLFDGMPMEGAAEPFMESVRVAAAEIGYPVFLRTGLTSGKHNWEHTCYLADSSKVVHHVASIVEFSELVDIMGLSCDWWAVREFLPTKPVGRCPDFGNMPLCREFLFFVEDANVKCWHPYWPADALGMGGVADPERTCADLAMIDDASPLLALASKAGAAVGGAWSIDLLETERGWFITDMAEARKSWHWPDCTQSPERK